MKNTNSTDSDRINENPLQENSPSVSSNSISPSLSEAKKKQIQVRNMIKGAFFTNMLKNINAKQASENMMEDYANGAKKSPFMFRNLFQTEPEIENEEEVKLGIHYSINFKDVYREGRKLGEGCMGLVKKVKKFSDGQEYAVKIIKTNDPETIQNIKKEFINIVKLDHPNIVKVYELYINEKEGHIHSIMELINSSEMFEVIKRYGSYSEEIASKIFKQILLAIQYMHSRGCCHRDLKPNNILCNEDGSEVKITDFNVSKFDENRKKRCKFGFSLDKIKMWTYTGTIAFSAPEILQETEYNESVDMWSAGVVLYTMLCGYQPFNAEYVKDLIDIIVANKYEFHPDPWDTISVHAKDLIQRCLTVNPKERINPTDALMHPWIAHTKANANILPRVVFENLRKSITRLSKNRMEQFEMPSLIRSKSGENEEIVKELVDYNEYGDDGQEEDEIIEEGGRRAISYGEDLNNANFFQFMANKSKNSKLKYVKSDQIFISNITEEEAKKD